MGADTEVAWDRRVFNPGRGWAPKGKSKRWWRGVRRAIKSCRRKMPRDVAVHFHWVKPRCLIEPPEPEYFVGSQRYLKPFLDTRSRNNARRDEAPSD